MDIKRESAADRLFSSNKRLANPQHLKDFTMIGQYAQDRGISTIRHSAFNYDGVSRNFIDIDEARDILDYEVHVKHCRTEDGLIVPGVNYLIDSKTGLIIPSSGVGDRFKPFQNIEFFDYFVNNAVNVIPNLELDTVATLHGRGTALLTTKFQDDFSVDGDDSPIRMHVLYSNDNTGRSCLLLGFTCVRVRCMNTYAIAKQEVRSSSLGFRLSHTESIDERVGGAQKIIVGQLKRFSFLQERIRSLASKNVTAKQVRDAMNAAYNKNRYSGGSSEFTKILNIHAEVLRQFEDKNSATASSFTKDSAWKLVNALTYRIFNPIKTNKKTDRTEIAFQGALGTVAGKVERIVSIVEETVGIRNVA